MGEIFLAKHGLTGFEKLCVIKKVLPQLSADQHFISRFVDEAQVAIHLQHANVAQVFEVGCVGKEYFLALEFVAGRDLRRLLARLHERNLRLPIDLALLVGRDLANGLAYAHRRTGPGGESLDLVHCDISPPNVVVSFEGEVKIIDFGIAKSAMRITVTDPKMGFGKFGYMSPEQLVRGGRVDQRTDIYAAGTVLFEMLTGRKLLDTTGKSDYRSLVKQVLSGKHRKPSDIDPQLAALDWLVMKAVHPKVNERFQTANELRDAIQQVLVQRNPTISSDALAGFMRNVFRDHMQEIHQRTAQAHATNLQPYEPELADQSVASVTFASANDPVSPPAPLTLSADTPIISPDGADDRIPTTVWRGQPHQTTGPRHDPALSFPPAAPMPKHRATPRSRRRHRYALWIGLALALFIFSALVLLVSEEAGEDAPAVTITVDAGVDAETRAQDASPGIDAMVDARSRQPTLRTHSTRRSTKRQASKRRASATSNDKTLTRAALEQKLQTARKRYRRFKNSYGSRLDDEWADLMQSAHYAHSPDKLRALSRQIDQFTRQMRAIETTEAQ